MVRKKLPIGIQTLREIREDNCYYVDKTGYAQRLVAEGKPYFLSRPRRFGKSLFLDTLAQMFAGNKALFEGLACYETWDWDTVYPVVRLSFADGIITDLPMLERRIHRLLSDNATRLGVGPLDEDVVDAFITLIRTAEAVHGQRVVVLVDEYDKPIIDNITNPDLATKIRDSLRNLYSVLKGQDAHLKFVMLTGVSKFTKVSLFSELNHLNDITLDTSYSAICGYTEADLDEVFAPELDGLDRDQVREWYNGYGWTGQSVYNPYDLLLLFAKRTFEPYWFETSTPRFLVDTLTSRRFFVPNLARSYASSTLISKFDVGDLSVEALLFQTGYLTITGTELVGGETFYILGYPNREVRSALNCVLLGWLSNNPAGVDDHRRRLRGILETGDLPALGEFFTSLFAAIPYNWYVKNDIAEYEGFYSSVFYAALAATGLEPIPEDSSNHGRLDLAVRAGAHLYLLELKVDQPPGSALDQIKTRGYADKYAGHTPIHLVGVEISSKTRNLVAFDTETIHPND
ncbi:MAG: ATP-binding protein [Micrococcales bacterium]|nr:ATP-binding protein [Micrococcales bacterium]MCL2668535.1 ATP-binding protein [Micrococcales bacterium]